LAKNIIRNIFLKLRVGENVPGADFAFRGQNRSRQNAWMSAQTPGYVGVCDQRQGEVKSSSGFGFRGTSCPEYSAMCGRNASRYIPRAPGPSPVTRVSGSEFSVPGPHGEARVLKIWRLGVRVLPEAKPKENWTVSLQVHTPRPRSLSCYRGTSLTRNSAPTGNCSRTMPRVIWLPWGDGCFLRV